MKSIKTELKQFLSATLSSVMLLSMVVGSGALTAFADENTPKVVNYPTVVSRSFPVTGDYDSDLGILDKFVKTLNGTSSVTSKFISTEDAEDASSSGKNIKLLHNASTVAIIFDKDTVDTGVYDFNNVSKINYSIKSSAGEDRNWSKSKRVYHNSSNSTEKYIPVISTYFLNISNVLSDYCKYYSSVKNVSWKADYLTNGISGVDKSAAERDLKDQYLREYDMLSNIDSIDVEFVFSNDSVYNTSIDFKVDTSFSFGGYYTATLNAYVAKIPDSTNMNNQDFYSIKNAISVVDSSREYMSKFYLDMDSEDEILLPLDAIDGTMSVSKVDVGDNTVYSNDAALDLASVATIADEADGITEVDEAFTFTAPLEGVGNVKDSAYITDTKNFWYDMIKSGYPFVYVDGKIVSVEDILYSEYEKYAEVNQGGIDGYWYRTLGYRTDLEPEYCSGALKEILSKGTMSSKVGRVSLADGSALEYDPGEEFKFHIAVKGDAPVQSVYEQVMSLGQSGNSNSDLSKALSEIDPVDPDGSDVYPIIYRDFRVAGTNPAVGTNDSQIENVSLWNTWRFSNISNTNDENYNRDSAGNVKWIEFIAYDYLGFNVLSTIFEHLGASIDLENSYGPDITSISDTGVSVSDFFGVEGYYDDIQYDALNGFYYDNTNGAITYIYQDMSDLAGRDNEVYGSLDGVTHESSSGNIKYIDVNVLSEKSNKAFVNKDSITLALDELSSLKKGTFYNIVLQLLASKDPNTYILYNGGDLFTRVIVDNGITYLQYKYGELALASKPSEAREVAYDRKSNSLKWLKSEDEGLGLNEDNSAKTDDFVHIDNQRVEIYDTDDKLVYENSLEFDGNDNQELKLPDGTIEDLSVYKVKIYTSNAIGTSVAEYTKERFENPEISLTKVADKDEYLPSDKIVFTDTVTNTGNIDLTEVVLSENLKGTYADSKDYTVKDGTVTLPLLKVGESYSFTYIVSVADAVKDYRVLSEANVTTKEGATAQVDLESRVVDPRISVSKTSDKTSYSEGETAIFTDVIENTGDADLTELVVIENLKGIFAEDKNIVIEDNVAKIAKLAKGEKYTLTYSVKVTKDMSDKLESIVDVVTAEGAKAVAKLEVGVSHPIPVETPDKPTPTPSMKVTKTPDKDEYTPGDTVTFTETVTNDGDVKLTNVKLVENSEGIYVDVDKELITGKTEITLKSLKPGETFTYIYKVVAPEDTFSSKITATCNEGITAEDEVTVKVRKPEVEITVSKRVDKGDIDENFDGKLVYVDTVTNVGNGTIKNVKVSENFKGIFSNGDENETIIPEMKPGEKIELIYTVDIKDAVIENGVITSIVTTVCDDVTATAKVDTKVNPVETPEEPKPEPEKPTPVETPTEPTTDPSKPTSTPGNPSSPSNNTSTPTSPKTGDNTMDMVNVYIVLLMFSAWVSVTAYRKLRRDN